MVLQDRLKFRELLFIFVAGVQEYATDKERLEKGITVMENFIDSITARECNAIVSGMATIKHGGRIKN